MRRFIFATALAAMLFGPAAEASVVYTFSGEFESVFNPTETSQASFSITTVNPITVAGSFVPLTSSINGPNTGGYFFASGGQEINPNGFQTGLVYVGLNLSTQGGGGTFYYFFDAGALLADGIYSVVAGPIVGGPNQEYNLGNAGNATLVVSGIGDPNPVPEPMSLALVGVALAGLAVARRRAT